MPSDGAQAVEDIGDESFARSGRLSVAGWRAQQRDEAEIDAIAHYIAGEGDRRSKMRDHPAGERRPDENSQLRVGGGNANRRGQASTLDKARPASKAACAVA